MDDALIIHRLHFAFTITYHYLFPQLTMGLAPLIVVLKSLALWKRDERYNKAARFWAKIFAVNFLFGVITGVPMEFQFGTNWAKFSQFSGGVIATALAMEGVFAFFLESSFLGLFLFGEKRFGQKIHWLASFMVFIGSWLSGYFIIVTDAWMQRPVGFELAADGTAHLTSFWTLLFSEWAFWQYLHNMGGAPHRSGRMVDPRPSDGGESGRHAIHTPAGSGQLQTPRVGLAHPGGRGVRARLDALLSGGAAGRCRLPLLSFWAFAGTAAARSPTATRKRCCAGVDSP
jgi:hypothetical protein